MYSHFNLYANITVGLALLNTKNKSITLGKEIPISEKLTCTIDKIMIEKEFRYDQLSQINNILQIFLVEICLRFGIVLEKKVIMRIVQQIYANV